MVMETNHPRLATALYPAALAAVRRGEFPCGPNGAESAARIVANYAAADLVLTGRTLLLPMAEVAAAVGGLVEEAA